MHICVIGAGAMGSLYGGLLARSGQQVTLIDTWVDHVEAINREGLQLSGITGDLRIPVHATREPDAGFADIAFIQTDTNNTKVAAAAAQYVLKPDGYAVTLQNGVGNLEILCAELGQARVVGGLSYHSAAMSGPGHAVHTHAGPTWIGELDGGMSDRVELLDGMLAGAGFKPTIVDNIQGYIWTKFIHNCAINPICAVTGLRVGELGRTPPADALQTKIIEEALAIVGAKGIDLVDDDPMGHIKAFCKVKFNKPSMLQHMEAGKRTEIEALNGAIVREGAAHGIPTPYNQALVWFVQACETHRQQVVHGPAIDYDALEAEMQGAAD
jgi:2-dehydropantoate 2-reductase